MSGDGLDQIGHALSLHRHGSDDGGHPLAQIAKGCLAPLVVTFVHHDDVGDLEEEQLVEATVIPGYPKIGYVTVLHLVTELNKIETEKQGADTRIGGGGRRRTDG